MTISIMMDFLGRITFANEELNDYIAFYNNHIGFDFHGERFGIKFEDNQSGPLILNVGVANINEELASQENQLQLREINIKPQLEHLIVEEMQLK